MLEDVTSSDGSGSGDLPMQGSEIGGGGGDADAATAAAAAAALEVATAASAATGIGAADVALLDDEAMAEAAAAAAAAEDMGELGSFGTLGDLNGLGLGFGLDSKFGGAEVAAGVFEGLATAEGDLDAFSANPTTGGSGGALLADPVKTADALFRRRVASIEWPRELAGLPLGAFVAQLRRGDAPGKADPKRRAKLDAIGFTWGDEGKYLHFDFHRLVRALTNFMKVQADNCVPFDFVVPPALPWDEENWGYELGRAVNLARAQAETLKKEYPSRFRLLTNMEFM